MALIFAPFDSSDIATVSSVVDAQGEVQPLKARARPASGAAQSLRYFERVEKLEFMIEFEEIEDFIVEINLQLKSCRNTACDLVIT